MFQEIPRLKEEERQVQIKISDRWRRERPRYEAPRDGSSVQRVTEREREEDRIRDDRDRDRDRDRNRERESREREPRRLPTPQVEYTRRVKARYEDIFSGDNNDSFEEVRDPSQLARRPIRRVKEVKETLNKKGITEAFTEMFEDHFEELVLFMKQKLEEKKKEETGEEVKDDSLQAYIDKIRRVNCSRVNNKQGIAETAKTNGPTCDNTCIQKI